MGKKEQKEKTVEIVKGVIIAGDKHYPGDVVTLPLKDAGILIGAKQAVETKKNAKLLPRIPGTQNLAPPETKGKDKDKD